MSSRRTSGPAPAPPTTKSLAFPRYLLPSLRIPFSRRRISEPAVQPSSDPPSPTSSTSSSSAVPSLSTSPTSPTTPSTHRLSRARPDTLRCKNCATDLAFQTQIVSKCFHGRHGRAYLVAPAPRTSPEQTGQTSSPAPTTTTTTNSPQPPTSPLPPYADDHHNNANDKVGPGPNLINIRFGAPEGRRLMTGYHVVADALCAVCGATVGWKYVAAEQAAQAYKVDCFILETRRVVGCRGWEDADVDGDGGDGDGAVDGQSAGVGAGLALDGRLLGAGGEAVGTEGWGADWRGKRDEELEAVVFDSEDEDECEDMFAGVWDASIVAWRRRSKAGRV
ncbi:yippee zinc-binding/DNA-binding /Mis18, centromere assembly-domain-containing protein [Chaetomium fimeti]|uniref:Yippee zinc-binding/DNA-binding /Mis18, centromere assembly-domain-containing protein n=1 Tax=Chaetomium fimeti TaxID=1854472 RepID=A0AAE0HHJ6_9PEZI|nr:yippee zinc-binding/DNA-binding /Mis18, centromere assembly-domain-containing protein [Chaetomium fimeti]